MRLRRTRQGFAAAAAASVLLITAACGSDGSSESDSGSATDTSEGSTNESDSDSPDSSDGYTAGEYTANGSYSIPSGGRSNVDVAVTLTDSGEITQIAVTPKSGGTSAKYQGQFASGIAAEAVGVNIDDLDISKVSGSSLTSGGFNEAIEEIKAEAQS